MATAAGHARNLRGKLRGRRSASRGHCGGNAEADSSRIGQPFTGSADVRALLLRGNGWSGRLQCPHGDLLDHGWAETCDKPRRAKGRMSRFKVPTSGWKPGDPMKRATTAGRLSFANRSCPTVAGSTGRGWVVAWPEGTYGDVYDGEPAVFDADGSLLAVEGDELRFGGHGSETYKPTPCESAERVWLVQGAVMHRQSYVFAVRPPGGHDLSRVSAQDSAQRTSEGDKQAAHTRHLRPRHLRESSGWHDLVAANRRRDVDPARRVGERPDLPPGAYGARTVR